MAPPRDAQQRRHDTLEVLAEPRADAWVATASADGRAHMVPLSIDWTGESIVLVTEARSVTVLNLRSSPHVRVGLGGTRDVVMIIAELVGDHSLFDAPPSLVEAFAGQSGWDPRHESSAERYRVLELRPVQMQAWREANEIAGRTLMQDGLWFDRSR